jgi:hypothetical protein
VPEQPTDVKSVKRATGLPPPATAEEQAKKKSVVAPSRKPWDPPPPPSPHKGKACLEGHLTKECLEDGWGAECYNPANQDVLVALPYDRRMKPALVQLMFANLHALECANHGFNLVSGLGG